MKKVLLKTALLPVALLFGASVAAAAPAFADLDTDGDGALSVEETMAVEGLDFETADADGDGVLSEDEFKAATETMEGEEGGATDE